MQSVVTVRGAAGTPVRMHAYSRPSTDYRVVRTGVVGPDGTVTFRIVPGTNTRLFASVAGQTGNVVPGVLAALAVCVVIGLANGLIVTRLHVHGFIAGTNAAAEPGA